MIITCTLADASALQTDDDAKPAGGLPSPPSRGDPPRNYCPRCEKTDKLVMIPSWHCDACGWRGTDGGIGCTVHVGSVETDRHGVTTYTSDAIRQADLDAAKALLDKDRTARQKILARVTAASAEPVGEGEVIR